MAITTSATESRACRACRVVLPLETFHKNKTSKNGRHLDCPSCRTEESRKRREKDPAAYRARGNAAANKWRAKNPLYRQASYVQKRFGVSVDELNGHVERLVAAQGMRCASCGETGEIIGLVKRAGVKRLVVDHDHKTGALRDLLCDFCNTALGLLGDDVTKIDRLRAYKERWSE